MQVPAPKVDITVHLGQQNQQPQQTLAQVSIFNHSGEPEVTQIKQKAKLNEEVGDNLVILIKYSVYPGRQSEALKYLQEGFQENIPRLQRAPLQYITRKYPDQEQATSKIYAEPGAVCVLYRFKISPNNQNVSVFNKLKEFHKLRIELLLKGFVSHSMKNRTNVKVDYARFNFTSDEVDSLLLHNILVQGQIFQSDLLLNPFYATLSKARKLHLNLKFKSFRQINKYYEEINQSMGNSYKKTEKQDFKYNVPGLFRQKVEGYAFLMNDFALSADLTHHGEQIFMRLVKVYFKAAKRAFYS